MLNFLTGDKWIISISNREQNIIVSQEYSDEKNSIDVVTLFSGGMDSLISTINYLEKNKNIMLISHAGEGFTKNAQTNILSNLNLQLFKFKSFFNFSFCSISLPYPHS